jgi:hypothetical protein
MLTRLIIVCLVGSAVFASASISAGAALGTLPPAIADLDDCTLPCWRTITPRSITMIDAATLLMRYGYTLQHVDDHNSFRAYLAPSPAQCSVLLGNSRGAVAAISLYACQGILLGDLMTLLGTPEGVIGWSTLTFRDAHIFVTIAGDVCDQPVSPLSPVQSIFIVGADRSGRGQFVRQFAPQTTQVRAWNGFTSRLRQYQDAPEIAVCGR